MQIAMALVRLNCLQRLEAYTTCVYTDPCSLNGMNARTDSTSRSMALRFQIPCRSLSGYCSSAWTNGRTTVNLVGSRWAIWMEPSSSWSLPGEGAPSAPFL